MVMTTFQKNSHMNLAFGNAKGDIANPDFALIRNQAKLVLEETRELLEAVYFDKKVTLTLSVEDVESEGKADLAVVLKDILDAQGDITTVNDGVAHIVGFNGDEVLQRVFSSNMSKLIPVPEETAAALQYYYDLGFKEEDLYLHGEYPNVSIKVKNTVAVGGKEYPANKFLKNMLRFKEPDFTDIITTDKPLQQIKTIIVSQVVEHGNIDINHVDGIATLHSATMQDLIQSTGGEHAMHEAVNLEDGTVESYAPAFMITNPTMPSINGFWAANVRLYGGSPFLPTITRLERIA